MPGNRNLLDPSEKERILAQYAGIFPKNIQEFGEIVSKRINKPKVNQSR